jgi:hypothetical protein
MVQGFSCNNYTYFPPRKSSGLALIPQELAYEIMQIDIDCLCGQSAQSIILAADRLPIETFLDHSNVARYSTGMLFASYLSLARPPPNQKGCTEINISQEITCLFCDWCSCHLFRRHNSKDEYVVASGVIQYDRDVIKAIGHRLVDETVDGGVVLFIEPASQQHFRVMREGGGRKTMETTNAGSASAEGEPLKAIHRIRTQCQCGGVQSWVTSPNTESEMLSSPWPDILKPYRFGSSENPKDVKW